LGEGQGEGAAKYEDEELKLIAEEIKELPTDENYDSALRELQKTQKLVIFLQEMPQMEVLNQIKQVLESNLGQAQVYLSVGIGAKAKLIKTQTMVKISEELVLQLKGISEVSKVDVE
jgi:hypothetical protein